MGLKSRRGLSTRLLARSLSLSYLHTHTLTSNRASQVALCQCGRLKRYGFDTWIGMDWEDPLE